MEENTPQPTGAQPSEPTEPSAPSPGPAAQPPAGQEQGTKRRKRRRRWPWVIVALVLIILLLIAVTPTFVSSGIGRAIVVGQINNRINGKVEIKDLSVGWATPMRVAGVVIYDQTGRQIFQLQTLSSGLTLINAARGKYALGNTRIDGLDVLVSREPDGSLNWSRLARGAPEPSNPASNRKSVTKGASKLPNVQGDIMLANGQITYEDRSNPNQPPVYLRSIQGEAKIPNINGTIVNSLSTRAQVGSAAPGEVTLAGSFDAIKNNQLDAGSANVDQKLTISGVDLAAIAPMLGRDLKLAGNTDANVAIKLKDGKNANAALSARVKNGSFVQGSGPSARHYAGNLSLDEQVATEPAGGFLVSGKADLTDLAADGQANPEKAFQVVNELLLDRGAKTLDLRNVNVLASTTHALDLTVKGKVADIGGRQEIKDGLTADLAYDLEPLWKVLTPLMTPQQRKQYADVKVSGKHQERFTVSGAYPSGKPFNQAVQSLLAWGAIQWDQLYTSGVMLAKADVPLDLAGGVARIQYHGKPEGQNLPPPIVCNDGALNLAGSSVDLRGEHVLLTTPNGLKALDKVSLNPVFASTFLGKYLNNPLYVDTAQAAGLMDLTIQHCDQLAIDDLGSAVGTATIDISIGSLQLGNPRLAQMIPKSLLSSLRGQVPAYHVAIANGILTQNFTLELLQEKRPLTLAGTVDLKTKQIGTMTLELPWALFAIKGPDMDRYLPGGIRIPFVGRSDSPIPAVDVNRVLQESLGQAGQKALQEQLLGKNKANGQQPGGVNQEPLKALQNLLGGGKKKTGASNPPATRPGQ